MAVALRRCLNNIFYWRRDCHVATHLAALVSIRIATGFLSLPLYAHVVFKCLQHPAWTTNDFHTSMKATCNFDISFTSNTRSYLNKLHFVGLRIDHVDTLLCLWFIVANWSRCVASHARRRRGSRICRLLHDRFE